MDPAQLKTLFASPVGNQSVALALAEMLYTFVPNGTVNTSVVPVSWPDEVRHGPVIVKNEVTVNVVAVWALLNLKL